MNLKQNQMEVGKLNKLFYQMKNSFSWFGSRRNRKDLAAGLLFLLPSIIIFAVFVYYALGFNIYLSFTSWNFLSPVKKFIGLTNFERLFTDPRFWKIMLNTTYYAVGTIVSSLTLGLIFALLLNQKIPGRGLFRTIIFSPYVTTTAAVAVLWIWMFDPSYGLINSGLSWFGITGPRWLTDVNWAMPALLIMNTWRQSGYAMVIFLGGLTNISREYYEAAQLDGANRFKSFLYITLPLLSPTIFFLIVTSLLGAFQVFDQVAVMTQGGPVDATKVINYAIYTEAFVSFRAGYSAAISTVLFIILLTVTIIQMRLSKRWVHYQ